MKINLVTPVFFFFVPLFTSQKSGAHVLPNDLTISYEKMIENTVISVIILLSAIIVFAQTLSVDTYAYCYHFTRILARL